jgi:hypothetical protein
MLCGLDVDALGYESRRIHAAKVMEREALEASALACGLPDAMEPVRVGEVEAVAVAEQEGLAVSSDSPLIEVTANELGKAGRDRKRSSAGV